MFKSPMWITPLSPPLNASGKGSHGSILDGNYAASRLSSGWKSTVDALWTAVGDVIDRFTPTECANYFTACGYDPT
jgi:hypothetical protein